MKSFLVAVFSCVICVLKPGTNILIAAKRKKQAQLIITEKIIGELYKTSEALQKEIKVVQINSKEVSITFWNGSKIEAIVSNQEARGFRCQVLIVDEYRMVDQKILDDVLLPFLTNPRQPGFFSMPEYQNNPEAREPYVEETKELFLSSGRYTQDWSYTKCMEILKSMVRGEDAFMCSIPFTCSLDHGLLTKKKILREMKKESMTEASFAMEYCGLFYNEADDAFFKSSFINKCRIQEGMFYPPTPLEWARDKKKKKKDKSWYLPKLRGEIRLISADIALSKGSANDNSVYTCMRLIPSGEKFRRVVVNIESYNGMEAEKQSIRLKQLFDDFEADYMIIDTQGLGLTVWSYLQKSNYDNERDIWYDAFTCFNKDNTVDEFAARNSIPVVYSLKPNLEINHKVAMSLRENLMNKTIELPINHLDAKEIIYETKLSDIKDINERAELEAKYMTPYLQTTALVNELINLDHSFEGKFIKIKEKGRARKDRYSSLGYANFLADYIEEQENNNNCNDDDRFVFWT